MTLVELSLLASLSFSNTPYPHKQTLFPSLSFKQQTNSGYYYKIVSEARCTPSQVNRLNPITAAWDLSIGRQWGSIQVYIGHRSEHSVGFDTRFETLTESLDYIGLKYSLTY